MPRPGFRFLLLALLIVYSCTGLVQVRPEERAVVRRFGEIVAHPGPGLWIGLPWGIDRVDRVLVRTVRQVQAGYLPDTPSEAGGTPTGQLLTGDQNLVNAQVLLDYAIGETDPDLDDYVIHRDQIESTLAREAETVAAEWAAGIGVDEVLLTGTSELPAWLMRQLPARISRLHLGVKLQRASVALSPPDEVKNAFEQVTQAQTGIRTKEYLARQEADQRLRQAEALRYKLEREAITFRDGQLGQARADTTDFLAQLSAYRDLKRTNPEALNLIWWAELQKTLLGMKSRGGRIELLDASVGKDGLDITQFITPKRR